MWFLAIVAGIVIFIVAGFLGGWARRTGHPALAGFAEAVPVPVFGACIFIAVGLGKHDTAWTLALVILAYAAGSMVFSVSQGLAERARRAGHPAVGRFAESASFPVSLAFYWVAFGLALRNLDWVTLAGLPLGYALIGIWRSLRRRRNKA